MKKAFISLLLVVLSFSLLSAKTIFKDNYPVFNNSQIIIDLVNQNTDNFKPKAMCDEIYQSNSTKPKMRCRTSAELKRDSIFTDYTKWLSYNVSESSTSELLKIRSTDVHSKLSKQLRDNYLLLLIKDEEKFWVVLFHGETNRPIGLSLYDNDSLPVIINKIAKDFFSQASEKIPDDSEREQMKNEPNEYYRTKISLDYSYSLGVAYSSANAFFFPRSWVNSEISNQVRDFNKTNDGDSTSAWNWIEDQAVAPFFKIGFTYARLLGIDFMTRWSKHNVKYNTSDSLHQGINDWYFNRIEVGLQARLGQTYFPTENFEIMPAALIGLLYSINKEHFEYDGVLPEADDRFDFNSFYKGAIGGISVRTLYNGWIGINFETGVAFRGVISDKDITLEAIDYPEDIAGSTVDYFTSIALEINFRRYLD